MLNENEPESARNEDGPILILVMIFIAVLFMTACVLGVWLLNQQKEPRPTPQQDIPILLLPTPMPIHFLISLPVTLSGSVSVSEQIWKVTKIKSLGYHLGGQRYDLATFTRIDGQETVQGYCINRGWAIPDIGTEYLLTAGGIFVPLQEPDAHPFQRFSKIQ
jgi:hypothetical protein